MPVNSFQMLVAAIVDDDLARVKELLKAEPRLATEFTQKAPLLERYIAHWIYAGDGALHVAAAGHRAEAAKLLLGAGADVNAAGKHRWSRP